MNRTTLLNATVFCCRLFCCLLVCFLPVSIVNTATAKALDTSSFVRCIDELGNSAEKQGVSTEIFNKATAEIAPDMRIVARLDKQPEFSLSRSAYLARQVTAERIRTGRTKMDEHRELLREIEAHYGVDPAILVAIWGMESSYGAAAGNVPVVQSLATLSCYGRRQSFFRNEFYSALRILEEGDIKLNEFLGSWAGAFGQTQFLPSSFERLAVDYSGDGQRNVIGNISDALASAANYLKDAGWQPGWPWGFAVSVPGGANATDYHWKDRNSLGFWKEQGVRRLDGSPLITAQLPATTAAGLLASEDGAGSHFLVLTNFEALHRYNPAVNYALAIASLAEHLRD